MSPDVVVIIPETSFTRAHSILTDTSRTDWVVEYQPSMRVGPHLAVVTQVQAAFQEV
jgi:hypothetical protein